MIEFYIPEGTPPSKNKLHGMNKYHRQNIHDKWKRYASEAMLEQVSDEEIETPIALFILCFEKHEYIRDTFNYADQGVHGIQDAIVEKGLIEDDNHKYIKAGYVQHGQASGESITLVRMVPMRIIVERLGVLIQPKLNIKI